MAITTRITYHALVYRGVFLEVGLVGLIRCQSGRSFRWLLLNVLPSHPIHLQIPFEPLSDRSSWCFFSILFLTRFDARSHVSLEIDRISQQRRKQPRYSCVRACVSKTETLNCNRFFLTFITSHDSIIRKRLHQRLPLTFAKCQSFSDRSCNIFLELTRCRNFDVIPGPRMHVHQSRMLRRNLTWKKFVHWISHWGWKWLRWRKISIRFLEKFESFPKFRSPTLTTNNPIDSHDLTR